MAYTMKLDPDEQWASASPTTEKLQRAGESIGIAAGKTVARSREFAALVRQRAQQITTENPLQFLAVLAGVAAVAGFATRLWRSSGNA
jgi:hypothetical protein